MGRGELKLSFQVLEEYKWEMGQAKCRGKSFLVTGNISYLVRYISNLVISIYVGVCVYIYIYEHEQFASRFRSRPQRCKGEYRVMGKRH